MNDPQSFGIGSSVLTIAIAAGWVAFLLLLIRFLISGVKSLSSRFKNNDSSQRDNFLKKDGKGF